MLLDFITSSGNSKLAKLKLEKNSIELPTLVQNQKNWVIGDSKTTFSMNAPPPSINPQKITHQNEDIIFVGNFLMHQPIDDIVSKKYLKETTDYIKQNLVDIPSEKAALLIHPTNSAELLWEIISVIKEHQIKHIAISNFIPLLTNPFKIQSFIGSLRSSLSFDTLLYLLSPIPHTYFPVLSYSGIDIFSNGFASIASKQNLFLTENGGFEFGNLSEQLCFCEACNKMTFSKRSKELSENEKKLLHQHNNWILMKAIRKIRQALERKDLRSYVEESIVSNTYSASLLRLMDKHWSEWLVKRTATWLSTPVKHTTVYSHHRPAVKEFQKRIRQRFQIKDNKKIVVIFPCSARKPYSESRSHRKFLNVLDKVGRKKRGYIQELILTSPLGVIPRELESVYPAAHYDIPVTGDWSKEEIDIAVTQLVTVLRNCDTKNLTIIAHVANEYLTLCELAEKELGINFIYTSKERKATSYESLKELENVLQILNELPPLSYSHDTERLHTLVDYQFGKSIGAQMFPNKYNIRSKPYQNSLVLQDRTHVGIIQRLTGQITLTLETAKILAKKKIYYISFEGTELKGSTLFAVGVNDADQQIRPSDAVVILDEENKIAAVGSAITSGSDMLEMKSGQAAKIKQRRK
ncbi:MAG: hypothetical protein FK733_03475 [Asgard group archaeon]|nr:hypothetical protein [Asgard group archaeon]